MERDEEKRKTSHKSEPTFREFEKFKTRVRCLFANQIYGELGKPSRGLLCKLDERKSSDVESKED